MKKQILIICAMSIIYFSAMAQTDYTQYEVIYLKPKLDKVDLLKKGIADHNRKFHPTAPYKVSVRSVITGPNSGDYVWIMGPVTWTQLDKAPGEGEHTADWEKTSIHIVNRLVKKCFGVPLKMSAIRQRALLHLPKAE